MARIARTESEALTRTREPQANQQNRNEPEGSPFTRLANEAIALMSDQLRKQVHRPASDLDRLARALRLTSEQLGGNLAVPVVARAAAEAERAARFLENNDARQALEAVERFARQKPLWFLGGALAVGVGAGRFLKSSAFDVSSSEPRGARRRTTTSPQTTQRGNEHEPQQAQQESPQSRRRAGSAQRAHGAATNPDQSTGDTYRAERSGQQPLGRSAAAAGRQQRRDDAEDEGHGRDRDLD